MKKFWHTAIAICATVILAAPQASAAEVQAWTGMGPQGPQVSNIVEAMAQQKLTPDISPAGSNVACTPAPGENPVILIHGVNANAYLAYADMAPKLAELGKCVYAFNVGVLPGTPTPDGSSVLGSIPTLGNMAALESSVEQLAHIVDNVKANTGASEVDLVGHSAGATLVTAYTKSVGGEGVGTVISLAGVLHGTSLLGTSYGFEKLNRFADLGDDVASVLLSPSVRDLFLHSKFFANLEDGGIEVDGVKYVSISTRYDEAVTPSDRSKYTSPDSTNYVLQDGCSLDASEHVGVTYSPRAIALVANSLGRNVDVPCEPVTAVFPGYGSSVDGPLVENGFDPVEGAVADLSSHV